MLRCVAYRRAAAMTVLLEPFASVYDRSCLGVILVRGRNGFEAYAADDHSLGLFPSPRKAAAAITMTRPWVTHTPPEDKPQRSLALRAGHRPGFRTIQVRPKDLQATLRLR